MKFMKSMKSMKLMKSMKSDVPGHPDLIFSIKSVLLWSHLLQIVNIYWLKKIDCFLICLFLII